MVPTSSLRAFCSCRSSLFGFSYQVCQCGLSFDSSTVTNMIIQLETKGRSLEEMDEVFGGQSAVHDAQIMNEVENKINQNHSVPGKTQTTV